MKRILFPTDYSPNSDLALKYAASLCNLYSCELTLLHVCHVNTSVLQSESNDFFEDNTLTVANVDLLEYCKTKVSVLAGIKINQIVEYGLAADTIIECAGKYNIDMIVMGTKGMSGADGYLLGSNTLSVINKSSCPVLVIPEKANMQEFRKIVFATDYNNSDMESIKYLTTLAKSFRAEISIIHVADYVVPSTLESALFELFKKDVKDNIDYDKISFEVLNGMNHSKALNEYIAKNNIDLIAVSKQKKNLLTRIFNPSFTKKMLYHTQIPLLAIYSSNDETENE